MPDSVHLKLENSAANNEPGGELLGLGRRGRGEERREEKERMGVSMNMVNGLRPFPQLHSSPDYDK